MPDELVIRHCSPTLAGLKTGNMFMCSYDDRKKLLCEICVLNKLLSKKGLRVIPLRFTESKALIYVFRPEKLEQDLKDPEAESVLRKNGYSCKSTSSCITNLIRRLETCDGFPHEIGLFLGYPPEDVNGFIENRKCKLTGFWKVYGDAEKTFAQYRKCMEVYYNCWCEGCPLEKLAVSKCKCKV